MKKILFICFQIGALATVNFTCKKPSENINLQPPEASMRSTQSFEMVDKSGQYYKVTISQSSYDLACYHIEPINIHTETLDPGFKLACPYVILPSDGASIDSSKIHWFVPISGDNPFMFSGTHITINCFCEEPTEGQPHCDKLPLGSSGRFMCMPQDCYDCDIEICIDSRLWANSLNQPGFIVESESINKY